MVNNETLLGIVDYYNRLPVVKKVDSISAEDLIWACLKNFVQMQA